MCIRDRTIQNAEIREYPNPRVIDMDTCEGEMILGPTNSNDNEGFQVNEASSNIKNLEISPKAQPKNKNVKIAIQMPDRPKRIITQTKKYPPECFEMSQPTRRKKVKEPEQHLPNSDSPNQIEE